MDLEVSNVQEHPDGSATYTFDYDAKTLRDLVIASLNDIVANDRLDLKEWLSQTTPDHSDIEDDEIRMEIPDHVIQYLFTHVMKIGLENMVKESYQSKQIDLNL